MENKSTTHPTIDRQNNFNILRFILASLVILSHSFEIIDGNRSRELLTMAFGSLSFGELAVDGFFLLSGYLITKSWHSEPKIIPYLAKRVARIYPGFVVACLISVFVIGRLAATSSDYYSDINFGEFIYNTLTLTGATTPDIFKGQNYPYANGALWTIQPEFTCYLLVIPLGIGAIFLKNRTTWTIATTIFFFVAIYKSTHPPTTVEEYYFFANPLFRVPPLFLSGGMFYLFREKIKFHSNAAAFISFIILFIALFFNSVAELFIAIFGAYLIFYFAFKKIESIEFFQQAPDISYGVYLYGWPIQALLIWYFPMLSPWAVFFLTLSAAIAAGLASWYGVERPALRRTSAWLAASKLGTQKLDHA